MEIQCNRLDRGFQLFQEDYENKALEVLRSGWYVLGHELSCFEQEFAEYLGARHCVGVGSGLDALTMAFHLLGIGGGDEVLVQGNTFIASVMAITKNGGTPVFVEPDEFYNIDVNQIEMHITEKTRAILVVHLYGQAANMDAIMKIAKKHNLKVVEDCAQSHGAGFQGKMTGTFGDVSCFSFYPTKNLGAFGDGGAIVTDSDEIAEQAKIYRNYGSDKKYHYQVDGINSRLDEMQAGLLRVRLKHINQLIDERKTICERYNNEIKNEKLILPKTFHGSGNVWHQYVVRTKERNELQSYLTLRGIHGLIHYPVPPHLTEAYSNLGIERGDLPITEHYADSILSIPLYNGMSDQERDYVIITLTEF